jgi:hypothetical protein
MRKQWEKLSLREQYNKIERLKKAILVGEIVFGILGIALLFCGEIVTAIVTAILILLFLIMLQNEWGDAQTEQIKIMIKQTMKGRKK